MHDLIKHIQIRSIRTDVDEETTLRRLSDEPDYVGMHRGLAADDIESFYRNPREDIKHLHESRKLHILRLGHGPVETEVACLVAPERGIELYVVGTFPHGR